jgi:hypothetical protein
MCAIFKKRSIGAEPVNRNGFTGFGSFTYVFFESGSFMYYSIEPKLEQEEAVSNGP